MVILDIKGWYCPHCNEVEFEAGEGVRFAESIEKFSDEIDAMIHSPIQRVNVYFSVEMLNELDSLAKELNISRQAVIKTYLRRSIDQHYLARKTAAS